MAFTDHCDVFGAFHEDGFNRIIDHIRFQRPSMFHDAPQAIADNPALLCRQPVAAHPRLNQHSNPLVTVIDPLALPGTDFALNFSVQLSVASSRASRAQRPADPPARACPKAPVAVCWGRRSEQSRAAPAGWHPVVSLLLV